MRIYNIKPEAFDMPEFRVAMLKEIDTLEISTTVMNNLSRELWLELIAMVPGGMRFDDARLYSPELNWADIVGLNVPASWENSSVTIDDVTRQKRIWEYTYVKRSETDPTKCMIKYSRFNYMPTIESGKYVGGYSFAALTHSEVVAYYNYFSGFSTRNEAYAWRDANSIIT